MFFEHVLPRIERAESEIQTIMKKIPPAIAREEFARVARLARLVIELRETLAQLRALEGESDASVCAYLAQL